jgi:hypothetical protein
VPLFFRRAANADNGFATPHFVHVFTRLHYQHLAAV